MSAAPDALHQLIGLSRSLGDPLRQLAILGEGNTSARIDDETFWVKASGTQLATADPSTFVRVSLPRVLQALEEPCLSDAGVRQALEEARADPGAIALPSVETFLHAYLLSLPEVAFIGHTHPVAVNAVLCSQRAAEAVSGRLFPDEIVCCGPAVCFVEYTDPGAVLARAVRDRVERFIDEHNMPPRVILMQNHGLIAAGRTPKDVETITAMYDKTARVLVGAYAMGGPNFLTRESVERIHTRPDEAYRKKQIGVR
ncbi:MAG TPA: class II aldolase/adducin family protein [Chthonomonadales bacterium]|nr:class II aldolase/adducin family protein [Chthonomonadales bacterium]